MPVDNFIKVVDRELLVAMQTSSICTPSTYLPHCTFALVLQVSLQIQLQSFLVHRP